MARSERQVILASSEVHRHKGTVAALKQALGALGVEMTLQEWFEMDEAPHTFVLHTPITEISRRHTESQLNPRNYKTIKRAVDAIKPVRSHYRFKAEAAWQKTLGLGTHLSGVSIIMGQMQLNNSTTEDIK